VGGVAGNQASQVAMKNEMTTADLDRVRGLFTDEAEFMKFMDSFFAHRRQDRELVEQVMHDGGMSEAEAIRVLELSGGL
jgi:hypothetical protein